MNYNMTGFYRKDESIRNVSGKISITGVLPIDIKEVGYVHRNFDGELFCEPQSSDQLPSITGSISSVKGVINLVFAKRTAKDNLRNLIYILTKDVKNRSPNDFSGRYKGSYFILPYQINEMPYHGDRNHFERIAKRKGLAELVLAED